MDVDQVSVCMTLRVVFGFVVVVCMAARSNESSREDFRRAQTVMAALKSQT